MFFRIYLSITLFFGCVSLFLLPQVSYSDYPDHLETLKIDYTNAATRMSRNVGHYNNIKGSLEDLLEAWNDNIDEIVSGTELTVKVLVGSIISTAVVASSGGSLAPAAYAAVLAGLSGSKVLTTTANLPDILIAIGTTRSVLDLAYSNVQAYYSGGNVLINKDSTDVSEEIKGYTHFYELYLKACLAHAPWHIKDKKSTKMDYTNLYYKVTTENDGDKNYFHQKDSSSGFNHSWYMPSIWRHWQANEEHRFDQYDWNTVALSNDYLCSGGCRNSFDTPLGDPSHQTTCYESHQYSRFGRGVNLGNSYSYWICTKEDHSCPMKQYHLQLCPGTCQKKEWALVFIG